MNAAILRDKLLQVASGAVYSTERKYAVVDTGRYELIADLVEARKHSVVFTNWIHQGEELAKMLKKRKINFCVLDGSVKDADRKKMVKNYQSDFYQTILLHYKTGAHGLTLTKGTSTIFCSPMYMADYLKQAKHRIYRGGQTEETETILVEAEGTVEHHVYERLNEKTHRMMNFLDILKAA